MDKTALLAKLTGWVSRAAANGVRQHDAQWVAEKLGTVGGSSMATLCGHNPYSTERRMMTDKVGLTKFQPDIKPQWGNLFEDVIKRYFELDLGCEVLGEDLYVAGPLGTAYSPDGLTVVTDPRDGATVIALVEFKCPYTRIPTGRVPKHYIPQLLMGLDLFGSDLRDEKGEIAPHDRAVTGCAFGEITSRAVYAEAVFRRCAWTDCGPGTAYNNDMVKRTGAGRSARPLAFGINGFYVVGALPEDLLALYIGEFCEMGDASNGYQSADLGDAPAELFTAIMSAYDSKILHPWYGPVRKPTMVDGALTPNAHVSQLQGDLDTYEAFCAENGHTNLGIIPWKMFRIDYHWVDREAGYVAPFLPRIRGLLAAVNEARAKPERAQTIIDSFVGDGFDD